MVIASREYLPRKFCASSDHSEMGCYCSALCITLSGGILKSERSGIFIISEALDYFDIFLPLQFVFIFLIMGTKSIIKENIKILRIQLSGDYQIFFWARL